MPNNVADMRQQFIKPDADESFKKFEAVILEQFVQHMLPQDASAVFGEGTAGDIWKSMMAQQIGNTLAKGGYTIGRCIASGCILPIQAVHTIEY